MSEAWPEFHPRAEWRWLTLDREFLALLQDEHDATDGYRRRLGAGPEPRFQHVRDLLDYGISHFNDRRCGDLGARWVFERKLREKPRELLDCRVRLDLDDWRALDSTAERYETPAAWLFRQAILFARWEMIRRRVEHGVEERGVMAWVPRRGWVPIECWTHPSIHGPNPWGPWNEVVQLRPPRVVIPARIVRPATRAETARFGAARAA